MPAWPVKYVLDAILYRCMAGYWGSTCLQFPAVAMFSSPRPSDLAFVLAG